MESQEVGVVSSGGVGMVGAGVMAMRAVVQESAITVSMTSNIAKILFLVNSLPLPTTPTFGPPLPA